jgi:hypothetical protein
LHVKLITEFLTQYTVLSVPMSEQFAVTCSSSGITLTCGQLLLFPVFTLLHFGNHAFHFLFPALSWHRMPLRTKKLRKIPPPQCFVCNVPIYCTLLPGAADIIYSSQLQSPLEAESNCRTVLRWTSVIHFLDWLQVCLLPTGSCGS